MKHALVVVLLLVIGAHSTWSAESTQAEFTNVEPECRDLSQVGFKDRDSYLKYLAELKDARTVEDFAQLITYPLRVNKKPKPLTITNEAAFRQNFKEIFSDKVLDAIRKAKPKDIFCNYQGLTVGGAVWIDKKNGRTGIFAVNQ